MSKSPFVYWPQLISPKWCEVIVDMIGFHAPTTTRENGSPTKTIFHNKKGQNLIAEAIEQLHPQISETYNVLIDGMLDCSFEWYPAGYATLPAQCDNSSFSAGKWNRINDNDFTGVIFLSQYNENIPFDSDFEVYGGKLEFPTHGFGLAPTIGDCVIFPSGPNFIYGITTVRAGDLFFAKVHLAGKGKFVYNINQFPGNYKTWFK